MHFDSKTLLTLGRYSRTKLVACTVVDRSSTRVRKGWLNNLRHQQRARCNTANSTLPRAQGEGVPARLVAVLGNTNSTPCSKYQVPYNKSCYEIVRLERTFQSAQSWCERGGGHLVFINNQGTQDFLAERLSKEVDWWIGLVRKSVEQVDSEEESVTWLDRSNVTYSNWASQDSSTSNGRCGHLKKDSDYQWGTTENCSQELNFICEFESSHTIACDNQNATLQCGSGEVVQINSSFYGRKSPYFCTQGSDSVTTSGCGWKSVREQVAGQCHGLQACQIATDTAQFGDPCPGSGSYLSVWYSCKEGLRLELLDKSFVFENVTLTIKWLLSEYTGNLSCILSTGDGYTIDPYQPDNVSSSIVHSYTSPGDFTVFVECSTSEWHVTAQQNIIVEESIGTLTVSGCFSHHESQDEACSTIYGQTLWIQVEMNTGSEMNISIIHDNMTLTETRVNPQDTPHNLTLDAASQKIIGPGVHQLQIVASSHKMSIQLNTNVTIHLIEVVSGLQAHLSANTVEAGKELQINVTVSNGIPAAVVIEITGSNDTMKHSGKCLTTQPHIYNITIGTTGVYMVTVNAGNAVSNISLHIGNVTVTENIKTENHGRLDKEGKNVIKEKSRMHITPRRHVSPFSNITLQWPGNSIANITWTCGACWSGWFECVKQNLINITSYRTVIPASCLPPPNAAFTIRAMVTNSDEDTVEDEQCFYVTAKSQLQPKIRCETNCKNVNISEEVVVSAACENCEGVTYSWYIDMSLVQKSAALPAVCHLRDFRPSSLILLQSDLSTLVLNSTLLKNLSEGAVRIKLIAKTLHESGEDTIVVSTLLPPEVPRCTIYPNEGTVMTSFQISCLSPCSLNDSCVQDQRISLTYCFYPKPNSQLYCGPNQELPSVYLPLGEEEYGFLLNITVTVTNSFGDSVSTMVKVKVTYDETSADSLATFLSERSTNLLKEGSDSSSLIQLYKSVSSVLNQKAMKDNQNVSLQADNKKELREVMITALSTVNVTTLHTALEMSEVMKDITMRSEELSSSAQMEAISVLRDVSQSLLTISNEQDPTKETTANYLFNAMSNVLEASAKNGTAESSMSTMSHHLLNVVENLQSALLVGKLPDNKPMVLMAPAATMYINRLQSDQAEGASVIIPDVSTAAFTLPSLSSLNLLMGDEEALDLRMVSFSVNPFSSKTFDITGSVGGLSLTSMNGSVIPVKDLSEYIEIMLPRDSIAGGEKSTLFLANLSALLVNITSPHYPLVLHLEPSEDIPLKLYLGYEYHPNETNYDISTHLPNGQYPGDKVYSWVINPEELYGDGSYYLTIIPEIEEDKHSVSISVTSFTSQCVFWDEVSQEWNNTGCHVGPKTTPQSIQCLCTHLTFFGSSFIVMPNAVDVSRTIELFATFVDNPVVVTTVGCIALVYVMVLIWARRKDIQDNAKVKIIALEDNDPFAQYRYLVTVFTGHRRGAATTSKVTITLYGSDGESEPHHLYDQDGIVFERGGCDVFLITTVLPLGEVQRIRLWHDNSGDKPSWYVNRVLVHDVEMDQRWYFLCNSWLSIEVGDCVLDKMFSVATEEDMKQFSNLFFMKTSKGFRDGHIWYSVFSRSPRSPFTRVQRVSCCFSLLLCTMLTSIMFWGVPTDPAEQKMDLGKIEFTWQEVMIGFESSLLMFPINLLIVQIFRNVRPKPTKESSEKAGKDCTTNTEKKSSSPIVSSSAVTPDTILKEIRRIANSIFKAQKASLPSIDVGNSADINKLLSLIEDIILKQNRVGQEFYDDIKKKDRSLTLSLGSVDLHDETRSPSPEKGLGERHPRGDHSRYLYLQLQQIERKLELLGPNQFHNPQSYIQAVSQVQRMKEVLENQFYASGSASEMCSSTMSLSEDKKKNTTKGLPWWFVFIGWFLVLATSGVSGFFTMLYGLHYGKDSSIKWLISMAISFFESLFITQPLKVLGFASFFALVLKKVEPEDEEETTINGDLSAPGDPDLLLESTRDSNIYQPPPPTDVSRMKNIYIKEQKVFALIREILAYFGFLWMLLLVAYGQRDPNSYYLNMHIENSFTNGLDKVCSYQEFFTWANTTLISNLYGTYPGFVTDGNSKLVGSARIRQVRVKKDTCPVAHVLQSTVKDCRAPYTLDAEDMEQYGEQWNISAFNNSSDSDSVWSYKSQSKLRSHPTWGRLSTYRGGGYVVDLGGDRTTASGVLQYLFNNIWLDTYTRAVFVEFTIYNANVNLFCLVRLMFETKALGTFQTHADFQSVRLYPYTDGLHIFVVAAEVIYFLFVIYYMVIQGKLIKNHKWGYFRSKWNLLELAIILISWSALSVFVKRTILGNRDINYYQDHKDEFVSFNETAAADAALGYLIAFLVLLSTIKLWHLLRLNPKLNMITATLQRAWGDISGFITVIVIMFLAYSIACNLIFGWKLNSYKTVFDSAKTMVSLQLGIFNYEEVLDYNPVLGSFLVGSCIIFMTFVVLNLFISVILVAFSEEQKNHQASEEEEIVDLMLMKICSFLGLRHKKEDSGINANCQNN
ncbi:polycystic kidney disease protein 1-like 2 [Hyla sarda]|uniref:polycystic kidney disease protein 1-like 2 n=1 Tax=Hyla sarda TaxID=327740 RepID=UPI0024C31349|nr:polycystic kidney disease protein 1-like 2 [Hyla sarda]